MLHPPPPLVPSATTPQHHNTTLAIDSSAGQVQSSMPPAAGVRRTFFDKLPGIAVTDRHHLPLPCMHDGAPERCHARQPPRSSQPPHHPERARAECTFVNLGGRGVDSELECDECSAAINVQSSASIHVVNSTFFDLMREPASRYVRVWDNDTAVLLSGCRFDDAPDAFQQRGAALIYSDNSSLRVETDAGLFVPPQPPSSIPAVPEGEPPVFQPRDQQWFVGVYKVRPVRRPLLSLPLALVG